MKQIETIVQVGTKEYGWLVDTLYNMKLDIDIVDIKETVPIIVDLESGVIIYKDVISIIGNCKMTGELIVRSVDTIIDYSLQCQPTIEDMKSTGEWLKKQYTDDEDYINMSLMNEDNYLDASILDRENL
jgi:hypothetical protein